VNATANSSEPARVRPASRASLALSALALFGACAGGVWVGGVLSTPAVATQPGGQTTRVAIVDLERTMSGLNETTARNSELTARVTPLQNQITALENELKGMQAQMENEPAGSPKRRQLAADAFVLRSRLQAQVQASQRLVDIEKGNLIRDLYTKVVAASQQLAERSGYDLVLVDDRAIMPPEGLAEAEVNQALQNRRVLHAAPRVDITADLITFMNNAFNNPQPTGAAGGTGATGAAGGTGR
jgi:Skp family chaperone for outer membrane proteins